MGTGPKQISQKISNLDVKVNSNQLGLIKPLSELPINVQGSEEDSQ